MTSKQDLNNVANTVNAPSSSAGEIACPNPEISRYSSYHIYGIIRRMGHESVRTTVDIPAPLYRKLKAQAAARGSSVRELVLAGVRVILLSGQRPQPKKVQFPLIRSKGPKVDLTNEQIYEHVEFP